MHSVQKCEIIERFHSRLFDCIKSPSDYCGDARLVCNNVDVTGFIQFLYPHDCDVNGSAFIQSEFYLLPEFNLVQSEFCKKYENGRPTGRIQFESI